MWFWSFWRLFSILLQPIFVTCASFLACVCRQLYQVIRRPWLWLDGHPLGFWIIGVFCRAVLHVCHFHFSIWLPPFLAVSAEVLQCTTCPVMFSQSASSTAIMTAIMRRFLTFHRCVNIVPQRTYSCLFATRCFQDGDITSSPSELMLIYALQACLVCSGAKSDIEASWSDRSLFKASQCLSQEKWSQMEIACVSEF